MINDHYTFKNVQTTFKLKNRFTYDSFNLIYVVICKTCKEEYIGEAGEGKTKLRDGVRVYRQYIRQLQHQQLKAEGDLSACGNREFQIFPLLQMWQSYKQGSSQNSKQNQIIYDEKLTLEKFTRNIPL